MLWAFLADLVVILHLCYVAFVVLGLAAILIGAARRWAWIRNRWFRVLHVAAIAAVAAQSLLRIPCPITVWENNLRLMAGEEPAPGSFVPRLVHAILFQEWPAWVFTAIYISFTLVVLATLALVPPRWTTGTGQVRDE
jgi:hypothetical protein